jgi:dsDNA-specific endonuclease/ATPase MutS2
MLFKKSEDWKQYLSPEDEIKLNDILRKVQKYRSAYRLAPDIKTAQLWAALLEMRKENQALLRKLQKIEYIFDGMVERIKKLQQEDRDLLDSLEKF